MDAGPFVAESHASDDRFAAALRGFGPLGLLSILAIVLTGGILVGRVFLLPAGAVLALLWAWRSRTPWREIGYVHPRSWIGTIVVGVVFGVTLKLVMKAIVMPLLGADPVNPAFHFLAGNRALLPAAVWSMSIVGFAEETVNRGFLFERLGKLWGTNATAKVATVLVTSVFFGLAHYTGQGLAGAEQGGIVGLVLGSIFAITGRLPVLMVAHSAFDLTALALIYTNLETAVAHFVFK
jgi:membrane protease YdiL (CAAX protease family)